MDFTTADLHLHSSFSDGRHDIRTLLKKTAAAGISTVSVTDHDTLEGTKLAAEVAERLGLRHIPGVEISAHMGVTEVHLLAYGIDVEDVDLNRILTRIRLDRWNRALEMLERLGSEGITLPRDELEGHATRATIGRPHIARLLLEHGHVGSMHEAFERYLGDGRSAWVPKSRMPAEDVLPTVREAGGITVIAHPGCIQDQNLVNQLIDAGVEGLEYIHPAHDAATARYFYEMAKVHRLLPTGGSDFHGYRCEDERHLGKYVVPGRRADRLLNYLETQASKRLDTCPES